MSVYESLGVLITSTEHKAARKMKQGSLANCQSKIISSSSHLEIKQGNWESCPAGCKETFLPGDHEMVLSIRNNCGLHF